MIAIQQGCVLMLDNNASKYQQLWVLFHFKIDNYAIQQRYNSFPIIAMAINFGKKTFHINVKNLKFWTNAIMGNEPFQLHNLKIESNTQNL